MSAVRVGVVGAGWIGRIHARMLAGFEDVELVAVAVPHAFGIGQLPGFSGARIFDDYRVMLDRVPLDAAFVCVPPDLQVEVDLAVVERGIALFAEKPLGLDGSGPARIAGLIDERGLVSAVGYQFRYLDAVDTGRELLSGAPPHLVLGSWLGETPGAKWWVRLGSSGGQIVEQATHIFDLARYLAGELEPVAASGRKVPREAFSASDIQDVTVTALRFESGAIGAITTTSILGAAHRVEIETVSDGLALRIEPLTGRLTIARGDGSEVRQPASTFETPYERQDRAFIDAVQGKPNLIRSTYADALLTHRATLAASTLALADEDAAR